MVAVGLMAIMMTMIAQIFYQATLAFRSARATMEIHRNARAILNALENDLGGVEYCSYGDTQGYFALSREPDRETTDPGVLRYVDALTFTTLAAQPGARYAAPESVQQIALVRYQLFWDGGSATIQEATPRPTYRLVKRVRFPRTDDPNLDMTEFNSSNLPLEVDQTDVNNSVYAAREPLGFNILSMRIRVYCRPNADGDVVYSTGSETTPPAWFQIPMPDGTTRAEFTERPPVLVEATLEMTDQFATKLFTFTQRFYVPASERVWSSE
jgi:hypothetical protein